MATKKDLAIRLSRLQSFEKPSLLLEQYPTDSEIASEVLWFAFLNRDMQEKRVADLGCGTGILGIGALMLGAKFVYFVDKDQRTLRRLRENLQLFDFDNYDIICDDVSAFDEKVDVVIQNPPFGTKQKHADKIFLKKAFSIAPVIYSFHKLSTERFVQAISKDHGYDITHLFKFDFPLKRSHGFHKKKVEKIQVGCWRLSS